jgi:hypothetical protein
MARIRNVTKSRWKVYRDRAREYEGQLTHALEQHHWEAVALCSVHLAIASVDAVTVAKLGKVWAGQDHAGVVSLLAELGSEESKLVARRVASVLEEKTRVEYGAEAITPAKAQFLAKESQRICEWAKKTLAELSE